jgi:hypothetical protein
LKPVKVFESVINDGIVKSESVERINHENQVDIRYLKFGRMSLILNYFNQ